MAEDTDYQVGKGRPPRHSQFKKGQSGNPKGRPKGARNLSTDLAEELAERVQVREGGRARSMSKQRALLKALFAKALQGDARAANLVIGLIAKLAIEAAPTAEVEPIAAEDEALLEALLERRTRQQAREPPEAGGGHDHGE